MPLNTAMLSNEIAAKNVIYICFGQKLTEIWSVKDPVILGLSQTAHPMIGGAAKIACYLLLYIRCWKLITNWMWASKMARYLCSNTSVGASLGRNLASVGSCGHLLITALPIASILSIFYTRRYQVFLRSSVDNCCSSYGIYTIYTRRYRVLLRSTVNNWCFDALTDT